MSRIRDHLYPLERALDKIKGRDVESFAERRLLLREAFEAWGDQRYQEGRTEGAADIRDAHFAADTAEGGSDE